MTESGATFLLRRDSRPVVPVDVPSMPLMERGEKEAEGRGGERGAERGERRTATPSTRVTCCRNNVPSTGDHHQQHLSKVT